MIFKDDITDILNYFKKKKKRERFQYFSIRNRIVQAYTETGRMTVAPILAIRFLQKYFHYNSHEKLP